MSEEERILEVFKYYTDKDKFKNLDDIQVFTLNKAIQGILDLYQTEKIGNANLQMLLDEEKEKNSKYLEYQCRNCANSKKCKENNWCITMDRIPFICDNFEKNSYISKDKIREKIKEIDKEPCHLSWSSGEDKELCKKYLQELLQEGDK